MSWQFFLCRLKEGRGEIDSIKKRKGEGSLNREGEERGEWGDDNEGLIRQVIWRKSQFLIKLYMLYTFQVFMNSTLKK